MNVNLSRLLDKNVYKIEVSNILDIEELKIGKRTLKIAKPISIQGDIYKTDEGYHSKLNIICEYEEYCNRCLDEIINKVETVLSGRLVEKSQNMNNQDDEEILIYFEGDNVHLEEPIITSILLALPMKALCNEECKGLCPDCGVNLNTEKCSCEVDNIDPRLARLKELLD